MPNATHKEVAQINFSAFILVLSLNELLVLSDNYPSCEGAEHSERRDKDTHYFSTRKENGRIFCFQEVFFFRTPYVVMIKVGSINS